jgi:hypothetical protein
VYAGHQGQESDHGAPDQGHGVPEGWEGTGSRNLYSLDDAYLMGVAYECSKAGMAAKAIGKLVDSIRAKFPNGLGTVETLFVSRGPKLACRIETREERVPGDAIVRLTIDVQGIRASVDREVARLG